MTEEELLRFVRRMIEENNIADSRGRLDKYASISFGFCDDGSCDVKILTHFNEPQLIYDERRGATIEQLFEAIKENI